MVYAVLSTVAKDGQDGKEIIKIRRLPSHREAIHSLVIISGKYQRQVIFLRLKGQVSFFAKYKTVK